MSRLIRFYLWKELAQMTGLILIAFCALYAIFDILEMSENVGKGNYTINTVFYSVFLHIPRYLYEIFPVAILTGSLTTLSRLAANSEYAVMRTSGISTQYMMKVLAIFALFCTALTFLAGEWLMPLGEQKALRVNHNALYGQSATLSSKGLWFRSGHDIVEVKEMLPDGSLRGLSRFSLNPEHQLTQVQNAQSAQHTPEGTWQAFDIAGTLLNQTNTETFHQKQNNWLQDIQPSLLNVLIADPDEMSIHYLGKYIKHLKDSNQQTLNYEVARWRKIFYPFAAFAMVLVALAFTPVLTRHSNLAWRIFFGMCLGVGFHFIGRFFGFYAELFRLPAIIAGGMPVLIFIIFAFFAAQYSQKQKK